MTSTMQATPHGPWIERWTAPAALLLFPVIMMQVGREWSAGVALIAAGVIGAVLLLIELVARKSGDPAYRAGVTTALAASLLLTWVNVVGGLTGNPENPQQVAFLVLFLTAGVGAFAAQARREGMARAMLGVAMVQAILTSLTVTNPSTASDPRGIAGFLLLSGYFTALWLVSAVLFYWSARRHAGAAA
jgi:hypothetical protein